MSMATAAATASTNSSDDPTSPPRLYLLIENPKKNNNLGPILRCASAFGITTIVAVGYEKCAVEGSHGASKHLQIIAFPTSQQAVDFLRAECQCEHIVGLLGACPNGYEAREIYEDHSSSVVKLRYLADDPETMSQICKDSLQPCKISIPVHQRPFSAIRNTCFAISKQRQGLPIALAEQCDAFVHVAHASFQHGNCSMDNSPLLLDSPSCLSITLHEFTELARYNERQFEGHKFHVVRGYQQLLSEDEVARRRAQRIREKEDQQQEADTAMVDEKLFGSIGDY